ncbi:MULTISPECIES: tryptophan halogenase family protein [Asticcacaulis]|uniref:tryptophan halogenase family protein n=1 Tax=Asticcacaulis TaxID=76890 RepID=UPI001AE0E9E7|nr:MULTISPECIES: tryptophan halogenase family protein [Asticcacaulis]MBP2157919.1 tryptophan halogenase [Asticcacaulis solisilvae]MDR6798964.1 tryptophan halogenase [Asticcacaulis sp. BE141]
MLPGHEGPKLKVVIVGGGTAGWMAAALLSQTFKGKLVDVTLVESDAIGTIGVGEATIPAIRRFNRLLEVHERDFIAATQATFKLGIEFVNWGKVGTSYIHPFGNIGKPIGRTGFEHYLTRRRLEGHTENFETYSLNAMAARADRFNIPPRDGSLLSELAYAYHFDAGLYAAFLRRYAEARGVRRVEGKIGHVGQDADSGHVTSLHLEDGQTVDGEFFIDCSGLSGLLIEKTLGSGYEDWSHWLPCDRAGFVPSESAPSITPYTRSTAHSAGWQWRIPLQHRIGNGHVFSSGFMGDDEAGDLLLETLDQKPLAEPKFLRFQTGRRKLSWNRNVVAIGLSSGFLEPLESTSIHLIHSGLVKLLDYWPDRTFNPLLSAQYNRVMETQYQSIRDFIILHYKATDREDSAFWKYCRFMDVPDSLACKMDHFRSSSRIVLAPGELFQPASWLAVLIGQNVLPTGYDPLSDIHETAAVDDTLRRLAAAIRHAVDTMPTHRQVLESLRY